jgi:predicted MFS family arabinose efflux permease
MKFITLYKNAFGGLSKEIWLLGFVMFINRVGSMVIAFLSLYLTQSAKLSVEQAGIILMFFGVGAITGSWLGGKVADMKGHYFVQFWSLLIGGFLFLLMGSVSSFYLLCAVAFILSCFGDAYRPANQVAIAHFSKPENFTRSVSLVRLAINLGWSIGPMIGGLVAFYDFKLIFWIDGITNILAAAMVWRFLRTGQIIKKPKIDDAIKSEDSPLKDRFFLGFLFFNTLYAMCFFPLFTVMGLYYKEILHFNTKEIGFLMGSNGLVVALVEMILLYKIRDKYQHLTLIALGCFFLVINYLIIFGFESYWMILVAMLFSSLSEMFSMPFMNTLTIERSKPHNRGHYSALNSMTWALAQTSGPLFSTQIISRFGYQPMIGVFIAISLVSMLGFLFLRYKEK